MWLRCLWWNEKCLRLYKVILANSLLFWNKKASFLLHVFKIFVSVKLVIDFSFNFESFLWFSFLNSCLPFGFWQLTQIKWQSYDCSRFMITNCESWSIRIYDNGSTKRKFELIFLFKVWNSNCKNFLTDKFSCKQLDESSWLQQLLMKRIV